MSDIRRRMSHELTRERLHLEITRAARPFAVVLGALVLAGVALVLLLVRLHVVFPWQDRYEVRVAVDDAKGVVTGGEVRISGVVVGKITGVRPDGRRAVLTARIEPRFAPLYRDARLRLRPKTPLEDMYLDVEGRGTARAGRLTSATVLPAERTRTPVQIGDVLNVFDADVRPRVAGAIRALSDGLGDHGEQLRATLSELAPFLDSARRLTVQTAVRRRQTARLVHSMAVITSELGRRDGELSRLVRDGGDVLGQLAAVDAPLAQLIEELPPTLRTLPSSFGTLREASDDLDAALTALRPAARALPAGLQAVTALSPDLRDGAAALRRPLPTLQRLAAVLPATTGDLAAGVGTLRPQAPRLDRVTRAVQGCELAVQKFFNWTVSVGKFYGVRGAVLRGDPVFSGITANGALRDQGLTATPSCAAGGPRK